MLILFFHDYCFNFDFDILAKCLFHNPIHASIPQKKCWFKFASQEFEHKHLKFNIAIGFVSITTTKYETFFWHLIIIHYINYLELLNKKITMCSWNPFRFYYKTFANTFIIFMDFIIYIY